MRIRLKILETIGLYLLIALFWFLAGMIVTVFTGCATDDRLREQVQDSYPECFVFPDLSMECPDPFSDSGTKKVPAPKKKAKK